MSNRRGIHPEVVSLGNAKLALSKTLKMKIQLSAIFSLLTILHLREVQGAVVYSNDFRNDTEVADFSGFSNGFGVSNIGRDGQRLVLDSYVSSQARGFAMTDSRKTFATTYSDKLETNPGLVSWSFSMGYSNRFTTAGSIFAVIASDTPNVWNSSASYYALVGGDSRNDRLSLICRSAGVDEVIIESITPLPESVPAYLRLTYSPANNEWQLFGQIGLPTTDPFEITTHLGSGTNGTLTDQPLSYFGFGYGGIGGAGFDQLRVAVVPEPAPVLFLSGGFLLTITRRRKLR